MGDINKSPNLPTGIQTTDKLWVGRDAQGPYQISVGDLVNLVSESVDTAAWSLTVPTGTPYTPANMPAGWRPELATVDRQPAGFGFNGTVSRASVTKAGAFE